jgi:hypothetical protein
MGTVHHLLRPDERLVVACFDGLRHFRESYDPSILACVRIALASRCGGRADAVLSQALLVDRVLDPEESGRGAWDGQNPQDGALGLLAIVEAAQSSQTRLQALLRAAPHVDADRVQLIVRFAALLLVCGLRLPRRDEERARPPLRHGPRLRPVIDRRAV